jgi:predicted AlkP superfamily phosphohydrolase/phosphomutase
VKASSVLLVLLIGASCSSAKSSTRVVVLGFDGLDFALTQQLMAGGRLQNFSRLAAQGSFTPLATSIPAQSPVAWSTFITGVDPGTHGIFDFMHRDPATMRPFLSTTRTEEGGHRLKLGKWQFPLSAGRVELLRRGQPFWQTLESHGVETSIIRMPANFPPSGAASRELSGMGTPDILGTYGLFSFYTSDAGAVADGSSSGGGTVYHVNETGGLITSELHGPPQPYLSKREEMRASFTVSIDATRTYAKLVVGDEERLLRVGEWSDWVPIVFEVRPLQTLRAECRFYLKRLTPTFELYASPVNVDPLTPAVPLSNPESYATELARATGRFYTQGMPEDTKALKAGVLSTAEFLEQARIAQLENLRQFRYVLDHFDRGLLFYYFGNVDQVSHMLWRARDPQHPAYNAAVDSPYASVIDDLYVDMDSIVGETLQRLGDDDLLVVMSDHGFASWRRSFSLNAWLRDEGYLVPAGRNSRSIFNQIDLSRSRAYGLGLNGLYINLKGREASGIVEPADREALVDEIRDKLLRVIDPVTGVAAIARVDRREQSFSRGAAFELAPDLVVGYAKGTRTSDESALGEVQPIVMWDNMSAWSGDHCMDPESVPGILLTSRPLRRPAASLQSLASALLAEFGIDDFPRSVVPGLTRSWGHKE